MNNYYLLEFSNFEGDMPLFYYDCVKVKHEDEIYDEAFSFYLSLTSNFDKMFPIEPKNAMDFKKLLSKMEIDNYDFNFKKVEKKSMYYIVKQFNKNEAVKEMEIYYNKTERDVAFYLWNKTFLNNLNENYFKTFDIEGFDNDDIIHNNNDNEINVEIDNTNDNNDDNDNTFDSNEIIVNNIN